MEKNPKAVATLNWTFVKLIICLFIDFTDIEHVKYNKEIRY